jgi:hypothetical protein
LRTEIAIPELRPLTEFGSFRDNRAVVFPVKMYFGGYRGKARSGDWFLRLQERAPIGQDLQSDGISAPQDWQARLTDVEYTGSSANNADVAQEGERRP